MPADPLPASTDPVPEWVTVAEAAERLGIKTPRQTRRYADRLEDRDKSEKDTDINGRRVRVLVVRWSAISDLVMEATAAKQDSPVRRADEGAQGKELRLPKGQGRRTETLPEVSPSLSSSLVVYEQLPPFAQRLLDEKDGRIADLQRQVEKASQQIAKMQDTMAMQEANLHAVLQLQAIQKVQGDLTNATEEPQPQEAPTTEEPRRPWWKRWPW